MSKICVVIGGTSGLGRACAEDLAKDYTIVLSGRNQAKGDEAIKAIEANGGKASFMAMDITDPSAVTAFHKKVLDKYGRIDVCLNAAGIISSFVKLADSVPDEFNMLMKVNVTGTYLCMIEQIKAMLANPEKQGGRIINFTSIYGLRGCKFGAVYSTSKHALVGLTRSAATEYAADNILINAVAPGIIPTEMTAALDPSTMPEGELKTYVMGLIPGYPLGRFGAVSDVNRAVRYLVESPWSTGAVLEIDGGFSAT